MSRCVGLSSLFVDLLTARAQLWYYPGPTPTSSSPNTVLWRASRCPMPPPQQNTLYTRVSSQLTHFIHATAFFITTYLFPFLQPWLNALGYWLLASTMPKTQRLRSYEAQYMDCGYWRESEHLSFFLSAELIPLRAELVDEWSAPLPAPSSSAKSPPAPAAQILRQLITFFASAEGKRVGMHAPMELRFTRVRGEDFFLSPAASYEELLGREEKEDDLVMWFEPIMCVPLDSRPSRASSSPSLGTQLPPAEPPDSLTLLHFPNLLRIALPLSPRLTSTLDQTDPSLLRIRASQDVRSRAAGAMEEG